MATLRDSTLLNMMSSGQYSDFSFFCRGNDFKVHKAVVVGQSDVIRAAADGNFKEAHTNSIALDGYPPAVVGRLIQFLYTSDYNDPDAEMDGTDEYITADPESVDPANMTESAEPAVPPVLVDQAPPEAWSPQAATAAELIAGHIRMNGIADYLQIGELVELSKAKLNAIVHPENPDQSWVAHLPALCRAAVQLTADQEVIKILTSCVAENLATLIELSSFQESDMITDLALLILRRANEITQSLGEELASTKQKYSSTHNFLQQSRIKTNKLDAAIKLLRATAKCRNISCYSTFGCHIDEVECVLRCNVCKCRHTAPLAPKEAQ